ncbi:MAG: adenine phosphoribosyltransferase [Pirellulales bacterium]|nr:adenine phosphoribosyltransferase [Pirellulales bacterium]
MPETTPLELTDYIRATWDFKPGVYFRDITPLLEAPEAFERAIDQMAQRVAGLKIDRIAAAEARGFLFAAPLALKLQVPLVPIRKPGKLPFETLSHTYELEYGTDTLEMHVDAIPDGASVLVVDDLLATGGTVRACCEMIEEAGGTVAACLFLIELTGLAGAKALAPHQVISLIQYD